MGHIQGLQELAPVLHVQRPTPAWKQQIVERSSSKRHVPKQEARLSILDLTLNAPQPPEPNGFYGVD